MKELNIIFTKSKKKLPIGSWAIRWWTKKPYSHVARKVILMGDIPMYYQANEYSVNYEHESVFNQKHLLIDSFCLEITDECSKNVSRACLEEAGKEYALKQNIGIVLVDIAKRFGIRMKNPWKKGRNCSELIYTNVLKIMIPKLDYDENLIVPHQIEEIILKYFTKDDNGLYKIIE